MNRKPHTDAAKAKMRAAKLGKHMSPATEFKKGNKVSENRVMPSGSGHYKWQDNPSYQAVHIWIAKVKGKPRLCQFCGFESDNGRQFHWSNISGEYKRDIGDWQRLCVSCHFKFDKHHEKMWATRRKQCASIT